MAQVVPAVGWDSSSRSLMPLPAVTAAVAAAQLIWRVLGPLPDRAHPLLRWVGGAHLERDGRFERWSRTQLNIQIRKVREVGSRTPLHPVVAAELLDVGTWNSTVHQRMRRLFALADPGGPPRPKAHPLPIWLLQNTKTALRVLTAVGPASTTVLVEAVTKTHRYRDTAVLAPTELEQGLRHRGAEYDSAAARWSAPAGLHPLDRDAALVRSMTSRAQILSRVEVLEVLREAGYTASSYRTPTIDTHPLLERVGRNSYMLIGVRNITAAPLRAM